MSARTDGRHLNAEVLVLSSLPLGDNDRIVRLLAADFGRLDAVARGAGRPRHRFQGRLETFTRLKGAFYRRAGSDLWTWREAEPVEAAPVFEDWRRTTALQTGAELLLHSGPFEGMHRDFFALAALYPALLLEARDPMAVAAAFAVRWSLLAGYGSPASSITPEEHAATPGRRGALLFLRRAASDPPDHWPRYVLSEPTWRALSGLLRDHVERHVERAWKGWRMLADAPRTPRRHPA